MTEFPAIDDFSDGALRALGYLPLRVSVFDHVLSETEAGDSPLMFYRLARDAGALDAYLAGEARFLAFYTDLALDGAAAIADGSAVDLPPAALRDTLLASLREERLMDVWFPAPGIRALGGWDRTDLLLATSVVAVASATMAARRQGLFLLS
jgi:hypothetical protein